jgi:uncharacterized cupredoxin-like copper-binding protein
MRFIVRGMVAIAVAVAAMLAGLASRDVAHADAPKVLGPGLVTVTVDVRYSKFSISTLHVHPGTTVRFLIVNGDPIHHEFIVGDAAVHRAHELGTEATHPPIPGEVSVAPDSVGETFFQFDTPGRLEFACHLPGHLKYGMKGWVIIS